MTIQKGEEKDSPEFQSGGLKKFVKIILDIIFFYIIVMKEKKRMKGDCTMIKRFIGKNRFLSNFYLCDIEMNGIVYSNAEAAFQAMKLENVEDRTVFIDMPPKMAKRYGKTVPLRSGWEEIKNDIMYQVCKAKFEQNPDLAKMLKDTGEQELVEGNTWGDTYWGVCKGEGENILGKILMKIRSEL